MNVLRSMMSTCELKCVEAGRFAPRLAGPHIARCGATTFPKFNSRLAALASPPP